MEEYKVRLLEEYKQLMDRLTKLKSALVSSNFEDKVGKIQYNLMMKQSSAMLDYALILKSRIIDLEIIDKEEYDKNKEN